MRSSKHNALARLFWVYFICNLFLWPIGGQQSYAQEKHDEPYTTYSGKVYNVQTRTPLAEVHLTITATNIGSVTNDRGNFILKVSGKNQQAVVQFSKVGYHNKKIQLAYFDKDMTKVYLRPSETKLNPIKLYLVKDAKTLVKNALAKRQKRDRYRTAFYREKISRGHRNVLLGEAVVQINEGQWEGRNKGEIKIYKSRKTADYRHLDTVALKFKGGPYSLMYMDVVNYPDYLFGKGNLNAFSFKKEKSIKIKQRMIQIIDFEQLDKRKTWFYGKLFIDAESGALIKADYHLNVDNHSAARRYLVVQKPGYAKVTPLETHYEVDYVHQNGEWQYSYSRFIINLRVNWKKKLFNTRYEINSEMVTTNRTKKPPFESADLQKIRPDFVMADDVAGFKSSKFWGSQNIIPLDEPLRDAMQTLKQKIGHP